MGYLPHRHNRQSLRLKGYDYSRAGLYFITICVQQNRHLFGEIQNGVMILNDAGKMVERWYYELENKYPDKKCHEMVVMPNHFHCIIENCDPNANRGDHERDDHELGNHDGDDHTGDTHERDDHTGASLRGRPDHESNPNRKNDDHEKTQNPYGIDNQKENATIGDAVGWFKTMTTNAYIKGVKNQGWPPFRKRLWQRNYHDHIIWNARAYHNITKYIIENPRRWEEDKLNK